MKTETISPRELAMLHAVVRTLASCRSTTLIPSIIPVVGLSFGSPLHAAPGNLDMTFGGTGSVSLTIGGTNNLAEDLAIQADGKIVIVGSTRVGTTDDIGVMRLNPNGTLDTSFSGTGKTSIRLSTTTSYKDSAYDVEIQQDGKILVGANRNDGYKFALLRYLSNGSLDPQYGTGGILVTEIRNNMTDQSDFLIQSDGRIVFGAGTSIGFSPTDLLLARLDSNGNADTTFNTTGSITIDTNYSTEYCMDLTLAADGKILALVYDRALWNSSTVKTTVSIVRCNPDGRLDSTFGNNGIVVSRLSNSDWSPRAIACSGNKIVVVGNTTVSNNQDLMVIRYNEDGSLDTTFNGTGFLTKAVGSSHDYGYDVVVQSDGKIVVCGGGYGSGVDYFLTRFNVDGSIDSTFNGNGIVVRAGMGPGRGLRIQPDGKIVTAGPPNFTVMRFEGVSPVADITVEESSGARLDDGDEAAGFGLVLVGKERSKTFTIKSTGGAPLTDFGVTFSGPDANQFDILTPPSAPLQGPSGKTSFNVRYAPNAPGNATATLHIASNAPGTKSSFEIGLSGLALAADGDDDGDGVSNEAELNMVSLGFDPLVANSATVSLLRHNGLSAGGSEQAVALSRPVLEKDPESGFFHLKVGLSTSPDLSLWSPLLDYTPTFDPATGLIDMEFAPSETGTEFLRVFAVKP